jgi:hypothetical protein
MNHYVTLFDSNFLPQGLALYESMRSHASPFTLWVLCMDQKARLVLERLSKPGINVIPVSDIETTRLMEIKRQRTFVEYCWTLTPMGPKIVFDRDHTVERVTYLDADMYFLKNPEPIHREFQESGKSVLITEHAYDAVNDRTAESGRYCVQFMTFVRSKSEEVRRWWEARCLEWCFARCEKGKFGDQKYLDDWPSRFPDDVHVLKQLGSLQAPWNAKRFHYSEAIAWHFHALRLIRNGKVRLHPSYSIPKEVDRQIYDPYVSMLRLAMQQIGEPVVQHSPKRLSHVIPPWLRYLVRQGARGISGLGITR